MPDNAKQGKIDYHDDNVTMTMIVMLTVIMTMMMIRAMIIIILM